MTHRKRLEKLESYAAELKKLGDEGKAIEAAYTSEGREPTPAEFNRVLAIKRRHDVILKAGRKLGLSV